MFQNSVERNRHLSASNWLRYGDTCSNTFFDFHRAGNKKTLLRELVTEGSIVTGQNDLTQHITKFYAKLYSSSASTTGTKEAKQRCWTSIPSKVSGECNVALTKKLSLEEIHTAINALPKGKAPGEDGLPMEFFHACAEETAPILLQAFSAMLNSGSASASINKGLITLIPKAGDRAKIGNWRPITLLGSTYKVLAKVLAGRVKAVLPQVIRPNQTGFVEGRSIIDNTFMAQEALEWAEESEQDLVLLLLDFEKAFDRIEWGFLFSALSKLGFNEKWIHWVKTLYKDASSAIRINGSTGPTFQLARSVRQGCPLAPYLFILATDVLGYMLADPSYKVEGLTLPGGGRVRDQTFADDTALYLQGSPINLDRAQKVIDIFCTASGAKVNWHKSAAIWASKNERGWNWGEEVGLKWVPAGEGTRYLGIQVGFHLPPEVNFGKLRLALKNKLINWNNNRLSLAGRILVANQVLLASMWYIAASWNPSHGMCSHIRGIVRNFIWGGRDTPTRAKVKWSTLVRPIAQGGLGIIDPKAQSEALLAKLLTRGLAPGGEPWKELIRHKADQTRLPVHGKGPSIADINWIFAASKFRKTQGSMWNSILGAWLSVRPGLAKSEPSNSAEILRQPLFGNPSIRNPSGSPLGISGIGEGNAFMRYGCSRVKDLRSTARKEWKSLEELQMRHHPANRSGLARFTASIPWQPEDLNSIIQTGDWISKPDPNMSTAPSWIYHVLEPHRNTAVMIEFKRAT